MVKPSVFAQKWGWQRIAATVLITLAAAAYLGGVASFLPVDFDEPVYFTAGKHYADALNEGDFGEVINWDYNLEHPPLVKLSYALAVMSVTTPDERLLPPSPLTEPPGGAQAAPFFRMRAVSAGFGVLAVLLVTLANPLAGLFLLLDPYSTKYSAQIYLEALPLLTSAGAVLAYIKAGKRLNGWMLLSAVLLGLTAASKYLYALVGVPILIDWVWATWDSKAVLRTLAPAFGWGVLSLIAFYACDPFLWPNPLLRLADSLLFNVGFATGDYVQQSGYPLWQPVIWQFSNHPARWHQNTFLLPLTPLVALCGLVGARLVWAEQRVIVLWWAIGMGFLLLWPTKWPQYILVVMVPTVLCGAVGVRVIWQATRRTLREFDPTPDASTAAD